MAFQFDMGLATQHDEKLLSRYHLKRTVLQRRRQKQGDEGQQLPAAIVIIIQMTNETIRKAQSHEQYGQCRP